MLPRIDGNFGNLAKKASGIVSKYDICDTRCVLNGALTRRLRLVCVLSIKIHKFALAGEHFNFLGTCVGASRPSIPNKVNLTLRVITGEIREALKGTLPAVVLLENKCRIGDPLPGHLSVAGQTYENLISMVLRESNMTRVYVDACVRVHMRGEGLLRNTNNTARHLSPHRRGGLP